MVAPTRNQQANFGRQTMSAAGLILQLVFRQGSVQGCVVATNPQNIPSTYDSMNFAGMEFFVPAFQRRYLLSKQEQVPAGLRRFS